MCGIGISHILDQDLTQFLPVKDINTHGSKSAAGMCGLFFEIDDLVVLVSDHDTETGCFLQGDRHNCDGSCCALCLVEVEHLVVVHLVDVVTGKNQKIFRIISINEINVLGNSIRCSTVDIEACVSLLTGCKNENTTVLGVKSPQTALRNIAVKEHRLVLCQNTNYINTAVCTVAEREIDDAVFAAVGDSRLCYVVGKVEQAASPATGQDHS